VECWTPAFAGVTNEGAGVTNVGLPVSAALSECWTPAFAGVTSEGAGVTNEGAAVMRRKSVIHQADDLPAFAILFAPEAQEVESLCYPAYSLRICAS
jgi:hypothetical protein